MLVSEGQEGSIVHSSRQTRGRPGDGVGILEGQKRGGGGPQSAPLIQDRAVVARIFVLPALDGAGRPLDSTAKCPFLVSGFSLPAQASR